MLGAIRLLHALGAARSPKVLSPDEMAGLEENARLVCRKYWETKSRRMRRSIQNQLNLPRRRYTDQSVYAADVLLEMAADAGTTIVYYS